MLLDTPSKGIGFEFIVFESDVARDRLEAKAVSSRSCCTGVRERSGPGGFFVRWLLIINLDLAILDDGSGFTGLDKNESTIGFDSRKEVEEVEEVEEVKWRSLVNRLR